MDIKELLRAHVPFLFGLSKEQIDILADNSELESFQPGKTIIRQGETVEALHLISTGKVAVYVRHKPNETAIQVSELRPGRVFGETSILQSGVAAATIKATEETAIYKISQDTFLEILEKDPDLKERMTAYLQFRNTHSDHSTSA